MFDYSIENEFDFASDEYRDLYDRSGASVFQHPLWLEAVYRILVPAAGAEPLILTARRAGGSLAMALPLVRVRRHGLRVIEFADLAVSDYAEAVGEAETFEQVARAPRSPQRIAALLKPFDVLRIRKIRDGAPRLHRLVPGGRRAAMELSAHATPLFAPFEAWREAKVSRSYGKELARNRRYMERLGDFRFELLTEPGEIEDLLSVLQAYRGKRYPQDILGQQAYFDFYRHVAVAGAPMGFARPYRMSLDGATIGGTLGLSHRRRFVGLILAYDRDEYRSRSLGGLTIEDVARAGIADGLELLDFSTGDEDYKKLYSAEPTPLWMVTANGSLQGAIAQRFKAGISRPQPATA